MKYLIALAFLTGSLASFADTTWDDNTSRINDTDRSSVSDNYYGEDYYEDESPTRSSATTRNEDYYSTTPAEQRTTGTMPDFSKEGLTAQKWHAGIMTGISNPKNDLDSQPAFGLDIGYQPSDHIGAGIEAFTAKQDDAGQFQRTTALVKGTFHLGGDMPVLNTAFLGAGVGPVFLSNRVRWAAAPMAGFDVPLTTKTNDFLSLGLNARYVFTTDNGTTPNEFLSALALKYWF